MTNEPEDMGAMSARLVAALSGVTRHQLKLWRRSGVVCSSALPPRRGAPSAYSWDDYRRARLAALLLSHGLEPRRLRSVLDEYCEVIEAQLELPTTVAGQRAIVKRADGRAHTAQRDQQSAAFDFITSAPLDEEAIAKHLSSRLPDGVSSIECLRELRDSWPLGRLQEYADIIDIRPEVLGGSPTLKGRRLQTAALSSLHRAGDSVDAIADAYRLARSLVERVLAFEAALEQHASTAG